MARNIQRGILDALEKWLTSPAGVPASRGAGFVRVEDAMKECSELHELCGGHTRSITEAARACGPGSALTFDAEATSVRLRGLPERIREVVELQVGESTVGAVPLLDLLRSKAVSQLLVGVPDLVEQLQSLRDALGSSEIVEAQGSSVVLKQTWLSLPEWSPAEDWDPNWLGMDGKMADFFAWPAFPDSLGFATSGGASRRGVSWDSGAELPFAAWPASSAAGVEAWGAWSPAVQGPGTWNPLNDRREVLSQEVARLLKNPPPMVASRMEPDGSVPAGCVLAARPDLVAKLQNSPAQLVKTIMLSSQLQVTADQRKQTVRLRSLEEQLRSAAEEVLSQQPPGGAPLPLGELLGLPQVRSLLADAAASSSEGEASLMEGLEEALSGSKLFEVIDGAGGQRAAVWQAPGKVLCKAVEDVLDHDPKVRAMLAREGEVPVPLIADHVSVRRMLPRAGITSLQAAHDATRSAVKLSLRYVLDDAGLSARPTESLLEDADDLEQGDDGFASRRHGRKLLPMDRDSRVLRELLKFYFDAFNLQHNRALMAIAEAQHRKRESYAKRTGYLRSGGLRPVFSLPDICKIPRVARILDQYDAEAGAWVLAAALQVPERLPVRISAKREVGVPRGSWAVPEPQLELTYVPGLRFLEAVEEFPELERIRNMGDVHVPFKVLPSDFLCVVSYSVSSDLSHAESPKAQPLFEAVTTGQLSEQAVDWEHRLRKIARQLSLYDPDVICVQGLQSIGFAERCSEWQPKWFFENDDVDTNHLAQLYREMSKANYGVTFAPTMKMPGKDNVCFGNAVFWKRSRWQVEQRWSVANSAICAELKSRLGGPDVFVCSSKSAGVFAREWGDSIGDDELSEVLGRVQESLLEAGRGAGARTVWCGDFSMEPKALLAALEQQAKSLGCKQPSWRSASASVLGEDAWTSASRFTQGMAADLVLFDAAVSARAVLGGLPDPVSAAKLLRNGNPSDHLMQFAVLASNGGS